MDYTEEAEWGMRLIRTDRDEVDRPCWSRHIGVRVRVVWVVTQTPNRRMYLVCPCVVFECHRIWPFTTELQDGPSQIFWGILELN